MQKVVTLFTDVEIIFFLHSDIIIIIIIIIIFFKKELVYNKLLVFTHVINSTGNGLGNGNVNVHLQDPERVFTTFDNEQRMKRCINYT